MYRSGGPDEDSRAARNFLQQKRTVMPKKPVSALASSISKLPQPRSGPLWQGPTADGPQGGVTQSMLQRFLACRERFRIKYVLGLEPADQWQKSFGYGNMWHACEEALAANLPWQSELDEHTQAQLTKYPMQREEITKWWNVCQVQFPEYVKYWAEHPDVKDRTPLMQEQVFDVPYKLPSGRIVRLRGKFDSVDLIGAQDGYPAGVWLQENKTKGDIDQLDVQRQLRFDLQTMLYLTVLRQMWQVEHPKSPHDVLGVRYNVVRRPLSGGKGSIRPHAAKSTKTKMTPAETDAEFYERLRRDYIAAEPDYWFFRVKSRVTDRDVDTFKTQFLDPILEQLYWWYELVIDVPPSSHTDFECLIRALNWRHPFGCYNSIDEAGASEYDAFLETGSEAGLRQNDVLFPELQNAEATE